MRCIEDVVLPNMPVTSRVYKYVIYTKDKYPWLRVTIEIAFSASRFPSRVRVDETAEFVSSEIVLNVSPS
jgi:hypothetical protein